MGGAIVQVRWLWKRGRCREWGESSAWPLGVHGASGHSCLGGSEDVQSGNSEEVRAGASYGAVTTSQDI